MSRRNFILLIIALAIVMIAVISFFYFRRAPAPSDDGGTGFPSDINPFGGIKTVPPKTTPPPVLSEGGTTETGEVQKMVLTRVSSMPIAGYSVFKKQKTVKEFAPALRYVEKALGYIYQTYAEEIQEKKFSNTIIPQVHEAFFGNNGDTVIMRYVKEGDDTIYTFMGNLPKERLGENAINEVEIKGSSLAENITDLSLSPDTTKIFYLLSPNDNATGIILNLKDGKKIQVFDSPFTEWLSQWPNSKMITLNTKPSGNAEGHLYAINPDKKDLNRIFGNINGLTTLTSKDGKSILYADNSLALSVYNINTKETESLGVNTLPEKCAWSGISVLYCAIPKSIEGKLYPDAWYKGEVSFSDEIWKINLEDNSTIKIIDPVASVGGDIDGIKLSLDEKEDYLFFVNKIDSYLWELRLR